jgi:hypothetical protein
MKKDKFNEAVRLNDQKSYLLKVKDILGESSVDLHGSPCKFVTIRSALHKKLKEIVDEEIRKVDQKIEKL